MILNETWLYLGPKARPRKIWDTCGNESRNTEILQKGQNFGDTRISADQLRVN